MESLEQRTLMAVAGLVAAYAFDEGSGATSADLSGNNLVGTLSNATWSPSGKNGAAASFSGSASSWVTVNDNDLLDLTTGMTLEAWVRPSALGGWNTVMMKERPGGMAYGLYAEDNTGKPPAGYANTGGTDRRALGTSPLPLNTWTHLATTYDGTNLLLFVNGAQASSSGVTGAMPVSTGALRIGGNSVWGEYFTGLIDDVRIYNRALSFTEIQTDMNTAVVAAPVGPDTTVPSVAISLPAAGSAVRGSVTVTATASDNVGVAGVQFLLDGQNLGTEDTAAPYSVSWDTTALGDGPHTLSARARDAAGNTAPAGNVAVTVDNTAPTASITAPAAGSTVSGPYTVTANASDNAAVAGVQFLLNGQPLGAEDTAAPFSVSWNTAAAANGTYTLSARARDAAGNVATSAGVGVTVSNAAPPPAAGLVGAWSFDEGSGTTVPDHSGFGNSGTISNANWSAAGKFGGAMSFSGVASGWVTIADNNSLDLTRMTLEAWVNPSIAGGWRTAVLKEVGTNTLAYALYSSNSSGRASASVNVTSDRGLAGSAAAALNTWTHIAATYDGSNVRMYINGGTPTTLAMTGNLVTSAGALRIGGNAVWNEYFAGLIDEVRVYTRALTQAEIQTDMNAPIGAGTPGGGGGGGDTTAPGVSLTSPADGAAVTASLSVSADASDNVGVSGVQFLLDGQPLGSEDTSAPYSVTWDPSAVAVGSHTLAARARDAAGNTATSAARAVTVARPAVDPAVVGQWSGVQASPIVAINSVLLKDGRVLMWDGGISPCIGSTSARVWDPAAGTFTHVPIPYYTDNADDIWCSGQAVLADGRVIVVGGHDCDGPDKGIVMANMFDPVTMTWTRLPDMSYKRWYPTATTLADGRVLVTAGSAHNTLDYVPVPEIYDPVTNSWTTLPGAAGTVIPNYAFVFQNPDGRIIAAGSDEAKMGTYALNLSTQTWDVIDPTVLDAGSGVMYLPGKVMKSGSSYLSAPADNGGNVPSTATTYVLDTTNAGPHSWSQTSSMAYARTHLNLTLLADGTVLGVGGSSDIGGLTASMAVYPAELWSPVTKTWTTMSSMATPRMYHSTSLLMPDGRVFVAGGGRLSPAPSYSNYEIFSPGYLFKGARPVISSAPAVAAYGSSFFVGTGQGASIASVSLVRNGSSTHAFNMDQRYVPLTFQQTTGGLTVQAPPDANVAPPGTYMLFIVNSNGVPSVAPFVRLPAVYEDEQAPTAPASLTGTGAVGTATLNWSAATDNIGVVTYNVYRSTTSGFVAGAQNLVGTATGTTYTDATSVGTYYYVVKALDAAGNVGPASPEASVDVLADTVEPTVALTAPAAGATLSGRTALTADASDNVTVVGVEFLLDGTSLGAEDTSAPYSFSWNTNGASNGSHLLTARARDGAGNVTVSSPVSVTISNSSFPGLVASYAFDEGSGTNALDASGNALNGTISNATWAAGRNGGALSFNGTNSWVSVGANSLLDLTNGMTLEAWVNPTSLTGWQTVLLKERTGGLAYSLYSSDNTNRPPAGHVTVGTSAIPLNAWTHLATTYDGSALQLYVNGGLVKSISVTGPIVTSNGALRIGGNAVWGEYFSGLIDEVRVYNRALTAAQVQADMNSAGPGIETHSVSGAITPVAGGGGATLTLTGPVNTSVVADAGGNFSFAGLPDGAYTVTPSNSGYSFNPANRPVTVAGGNVTGVNFTATPTPVTPGGPIQLIQKAANGFEVATASISISLTNITAGDFLIVTGTCARSANTLTISDTLGNTFNLAVGPIVDPAQNVAMYVWYVTSAIGGNDTFTITPARTSSLEIHVSQWRGISKTAPIDQISYATGTGGDISSGSKTTTADGELIFGYGWVVNNASPGAGFTSLSLINGDLDEYKIQTAAGPVAATFTQAPGGWLALMITFRPEPLAPITQTLLA